MSLSSVRKYFEKFNINQNIMEFNTSSATVELAAKALNTEPARIAKTLSFKENDNAIIIVLAGDTKIDNKKFKVEFGYKAKMLSKEEVLYFTGHEVGGVCPFGLEKDLKVYLDESIKRFDTVFPACGSCNSAIELTCEELEKYSNYAKWTDVGKQY